MRYLTFQQQKRVIEVWTTKNFKKDKMTGSVDIVTMAHFLLKIAKKLKLKSQDLKTHNFLTFLE